MSATIRLTMAQALVRYLAAQRVDTADGNVPLFGGVFAIFGHGNVAGVGEALYQHRSDLPTYRAHNEQGMAHAAIAYAKAHMRRRMMACTTSIGPGATNLVTAAALAHVNRLPVLLLPGDVFVSRAPDPVLQQVEDFQDGTVSANDCLRPVSRYFDRIVRPEQLLTALPRALHVLTDPALCGPVTLALPQDVQTMAYDYPAAMFAPNTVVFRAPPPERRGTCARGGDAALGQSTAAHRRWRRALRFGQRRIAPVRRRTRRSRCGNAGRQRRAAMGSSAAGRCARRDRLARRERARQRGRRRDRRRHAPAGLHDRFAFAVHPGEDRQRKRQRLRRAQVARHGGLFRRGRGTRRAVGRAGRLVLGLDLAGQGAIARERLACGDRADHRRSATRSCPTTAT